MCLHLLVHTHTYIQYAKSKRSTGLKYWLKWQSTKSLSGGRELVWTADLRQLFDHRVWGSAARAHRSIKGRTLKGGRVGVRIWRRRSSQLISASKRLLMSAPKWLSAQLSPQQQQTRQKQWGGCGRRGPSIECCCSCWATRGDYRRL